MECPPSHNFLDYVAAQLAPELRQAFELHVADCEPCRVALSDLARAEALPASRTDPLTIGRYEISDRLGSGASGVVYSARDPQLNRLVAIKLLRSQAFPGGDQLLLEEARRLARIAHPNVVTIFDAGLFDERSFIVMELIEGTTLRRWLNAQPRSWRQIVAAFIEAGQGLAAAHAAALTHRDFKPDNVLMGDDGRVRVGDFGLARAAEEHGSNRSFAGTPIYMAPEHLSLQPADARSDQFSYCVAFYEALFGELPFHGHSILGLVQAMTERPPQPPAESKAPRWLTRAILRGLSANPAARHPSMNALLAELQHIPRRRRQLVIGLISAALLMLLALLLWLQIPTADRPCRVESRRLGEQWNSDSRRAVRTAYPSAGVGAEQDLAPLDAALSSYIHSWVTVRVGACEDAVAVDPAGRSRYTTRLSCLDQRRAQLRALLPQLSNPPFSIDHAIRLISSLPPPLECMSSGN